ncbi:MAG TPA: SpoIID/LytB domain-containing protein [Solirubrobacterales bacterium]|jgi:stage II sporulation protein D
MKAQIDRGFRKAAARLAGAVLLAFALAPSPASAQTIWTMTGHGFGHGVGMSQYGAYGYALHGKDYRFMLAHYYQGTTIGTAPPGRVRVLLTIASGNVTFKKATSACERTLNPTRSYRAHLNGGAVQLLSDHGRTLANCGAKLRASGNGRVRIRGNGAYRGALVVVPSSGGGSLNVVNAISVDKYVQGVIAGEMPSSWPIDALKVQAVAARSYALASTVRGNGFNLYDDTRNQVYNGIAGETAATNKAAIATKGQVVMYGGEIARAYYSASSGGQTENVEFGFPGSTPVPYLKSVDDPYDTTSPLHTWRRTFTQGQIEARLGSNLKGNLQDIQIIKTGVSPRIVSADIVGSGGTTKVSGSQLQTALGGYSTWMTFSKSG